MEDKPIGKVVHYFDKAQVAVVKLDGALKMGDGVKFSHGENEFTQTVESMQVDHKAINAGKKGDEVAVKLNQPTHEHALVYKV